MPQVGCQSGRGEYSKKVLSKMIEGYLHEEEYHLAWNVPADPVHIHVPLASHPAARTAQFQFMSTGGSMRQIESMLPF